MMQFSKFSYNGNAHLLSKISLSAWIVQLCAVSMFLEQKFSLVECLKSTAKMCSNSFTDSRWKHMGLNGFGVILCLDLYTWAELCMSGVPWANDREKAG